MKIKSVEEFKKFAHSKVKDYCKEVIDKDNEKYYHEQIDKLDGPIDGAYGEFLEWLSFNYID